MGNWEPSGFKVESYVGRVVAPAEDKFDGKVTELRLAVSHGYKSKDDGQFVQTGVTYVTHSASGEYADALKDAGQGDLVKIDNNPSLTTRNYETKDGTKGSAVESRYGSLTVLERKGEGQKSDGGFAPSGGGF